MNTLSDFLKKKEEELSDFEKARIALSQDREPTDFEKAREALNKSQVSSQLGLQHAQRDFQRNTPYGMVNPTIQTTAVTAYQRQKEMLKLAKPVPDIEEKLVKFDLLIEKTIPQFESKVTAEARKQGMSFTDMIGMSFFKTDDTRARERFAELAQSDIPPERAKQVADAKTYGKDIEFTAEEKGVLRSYDKWETVWNVVDALFIGIDVATFGASAVARTALKDTIKKAAQTGTREGIRKILVENYPKLKDTVQLEQATGIISRVDDINTLKESGQYKELLEISKTGGFLRGTGEFFDATTDAQGVTQAGRQTVSEVTDVRRSITSVLRGDDSMRLSEQGILASEIRAGLLPRATKIGDSIDVFSLGSGKGSLGEQVTLNKDLAYQKVFGDPRILNVKVEDLVRLPDGTFVIAPRTQLAPDLTPAISGVRREIQGTVASAEKRAIQTAQKQKATQEALEKAKSLADEQEASRLAKADVARVIRKVEIEKTIKDAPIELVKRKSEVDVNVAKALARLRVLAQGVKQTETKVKTVQKAIAKAKKQGRATTKITQSLTKAKSDLAKAKAKAPKDIKIEVAKIKATANLRKAELLQESKETITEAREILQKTVNKENLITQMAEKTQKQVAKIEGKLAKLEESKAGLASDYGSQALVPAEVIRKIDNDIALLKKEIGEALETSKTVDEFPTVSFPVKATGTTSNQTSEAGEKFFSLHYEKIKAELDALPDDVVLMDRMNLRDEVGKALDFIALAREDAMRVAYGLVNPPAGVNVNAVQSSLSQILKTEGKLDQSRALAQRFSRSLTEAAQDLNFGKIDSGPAGERIVEATILGGRMEKIGDKLPGSSTAKEKALTQIKAGAKEASNEVKEGIKPLDDLLLDLTCK